MFSLDCYIFWRVFVKLLYANVSCKLVWGKKGILCLIFSPYIKLCSNHTYMVLLKDISLNTVRWNSRSSFCSISAHALYIIYYYLLFYKYFPCVTIFHCVCVGKSCGELALGLNVKACGWEVSVPDATNRLHCSLGIKHGGKKKKLEL